MLFWHQQMGSLVLPASCGIPAHQTLGCTSNCSCLHLMCCLACPGPTCLKVCWYYCFLKLATCHNFRSPWILFQIHISHGVPRSWNGNSGWSGWLHIEPPTHATFNTCGSQRSDLIDGCWVFTHHVDADVSPLKIYRIIWLDFPWLLSRAPLDSLQPFKRHN